MNQLANLQCEACRKDAPQLSEQELQNLRSEIPDWNVVTDDSVRKLSREFSFENFVEALNFANKVGELAERENHHPEIIVTWGKTTVTWWTHKINGLHRNDVIMAAKTDELV